MNTIAKTLPKLIKNLIFVILLLSFSINAKDNNQVRMLNPNLDQINLRLAISKEEHMKGLSGLKTSEFKENEGMLFINEEMGPRRFWMPDTYFDLDIIFLDDNFKIVGLEKSVPFHVGRNEPPAIYRTGTYYAKYVLEIKSKSRFGKNLKLNDLLKIKGLNSLLEIKSNAHQKQ